MTNKNENAIEKTTAEMTAPEQGSASAMLSVITKAAENPDVDADKMERLLDMQLRLMDKDSEVRFNKAFAGLQQEIPRVTKHGDIIVRGKKQSDFGQYEDLDRVLRPLLNKHGMGLRFTTIPDKDGEGSVYVGTLAHSAGHKITSQMWLPYDHSGSKNGVQAGGSTMSYARRYLASALLNIVFEGEDNDGNKPNPKISATQAAALEDQIEESGASKTKFLSFADVEKIEEIRDGDLGKLQRALEKKAKNKGGQE